ncbi:mutator protein MutT [Motilibacter peucedani]|uniref:Mutator protein MutT n=1 Tax=Motilibacter peucedani TaxID=598650 RepID=A0A420XM02_9ACTN|nr:EamA family transporter [Motilibacter peucedani]RKS72411.1 mutator protein MutT [Motilibacter peucedani]
MTRRGWVLFAAMSVLWGVPYLLIKVAVDDGVSPFVVVAGRTLLGALLLLPFALRGGQFRALRGHVPPLLLFAAIEMAGPWLFLTHAESQLSSSLAALLIAMTPLAAAVMVTTLGHERLEGRRLVGLAVGVVGVAALVGIDIGSVEPLAVVETVATAIGYAAGPVIISRRLRDVPAMAVITASLLVTGLLYLPFAVVEGSGGVPGDAIAAIAGLGVVCTAVAFVVFFRLIAEVGPARAPVFTYVNPAVALVLGVVLLDEPFTLGIALGFPLVILGSVLSTSRGRGPVPEAAPAVVVAAAVLRDGALLAARRSAPPELAGRWELPGGKVEPGEHEADALVRELGEELGVVVRVSEQVGGDRPLPGGRVLRVWTAELLDGEPTPLQDHDELRWLPAGEWAQVPWLDADLPAVRELGQRRAARSGSGW